MKKNILLMAVFALMLVVPSATNAALPEVGGNPVVVNKCTQTGNDISIENNGVTNLLTTACRQTEYGYKFYTMKCTSEKEYFVDWRPCTSNEIAAVAKVSCTEGDAGLNYNASSWATGVIEGSTSMATVNDSCGNNVGEYNQEKGAYVAERNCSNGYVHTQWYKCENGCSDGACLKEAVPAPVEALACFESDNGLNYNVSGNATGQLENGLSKGTFSDSCGDFVGDSGKTEGAYVDEKNCSYGKVHDQWYKCENGCFAGACKAKPAETLNAKCSETDKFLYNVFGTATGNDEVTGAFGTYGDSCGMYIGDKNKTSGSYIAETHCSSAGSKVYVHTQWYKCPAGCVSGACQAKPGANENQVPFDNKIKTIITSPVNNAILTNIPRVANLAWYKIDNASQYEVEVSCDKCGGELWSTMLIWKTLTNNFQTPPLFDGDYQYKARVTPFLADGSTALPSDYTYFTFKTGSTTSGAGNYTLPACDNIQGGNANFIICAGYSIEHQWSGSMVKVMEHDGETASVELVGLSENDADLVLNEPETFYITNKPGKYLTATYLGIGAEGRGLIKIESNTTFKDSYSDSCTNEKGVNGIYAVCKNNSFSHDAENFQFKVTKYDNKYVWLKLSGTKGNNIVLKLNSKKKYALKKAGVSVELTYLGKAFSGGAKVKVTVIPAK